MYAHTKKFFFFIFYIILFLFDLIPCVNYTLPRYIVMIYNACLRRRMPRSSGGKPWSSSATPPSSTTWLRSSSWCLRTPARYNFAVGCDYLSNSAIVWHSYGQDKHDLCKIYKFSVSPPNGNLLWKSRTYSLLITLWYCLMYFYCKASVYIVEFSFKKATLDLEIVHLHVPIVC